MQLTLYPEVNEVLGVILAGIRANLGDKLIGLYAFGSLVTGDFNVARSDLDLAAVLADDLDEDEFARLREMHAEIAREFPAWDDRIEVGYISVANVLDFDPRCTIAVISPGEPFHFRVAHEGWCFNLDVLRKQGLMISGPAPETLIGPISMEELDLALKDLMRYWREWTDDPDPHLRHSQQAYPIMTMCRALRAYRTGDYVSKNEAVHWAANELSDWSSLILDSVQWRDEPDGDYGDPEESYPEVIAFVRYVCDLIISDQSESL
jgi:predicted nucleotidyltransferase